MFKDFSKLTLIIFFFHSNFVLAINNQIIDDQFKLGLENITNKKLLKNLLTPINGQLPKIGLITNQTGVDQNGNRNIDILLSKGFNVKVIYVPEHGFDGNTKAEKKIGDSIDQKSGIPIVSLYDGDSKFRNFNKHDLTHVDIFIFDIQDSGMRHYTYISILYKMMELAGNFNKEIIVLDRPNPLGIPMEGPLVDSDLISFVSIAPIPLRHAMTIGELARYFNRFEFKKPAKLTVVPMRNYKRDRGLNGKLPVFLSPNIKNYQASLNYSFLGIMGDIAPFTVLAGTPLAFKALMLPESLKFSANKWNQLKRILENQNVKARNFNFVKDNGINYQGVTILINDINNFSNMNTLLVVLEFFKKEGIKFNFASIFNKLLGTPKFKELLHGKLHKQKFVNYVNNNLKIFFSKVKTLLIYEPLPKIIELKI